MPIKLASHTDAENYWAGGNFELNLSFETLKDDQWRLILDSLWGVEELKGPFESRYVPHQQQPPIRAINYPEPTVAFTQHGGLQLESQIVGVDILVTRSLFEGITLMVPAGMFAGLRPGKNGGFKLKDNLPRRILEEQYRKLALSLYTIVPFSIGSIGFNRECQILSELIFEEDIRKQFFSVGNSFITDRALEKCGGNPEDFELAAPGLRWLPTRD